MHPIEEMAGLLGSSVLMGAGLTMIGDDMAGREHILNALRPGIVRVSELLRENSEEKLEAVRLCSIAKDFHRVNVDIIEACRHRPTTMPGLAFLNAELRGILAEIQDFFCMSCSCPMKWDCMCEESCDDCVCGACGSRKVEWGEPCC